MPAGLFSILQRDTHPRPNSAGSSLAPTLPDRLAEFVRPGWARTLRARRIGAGLLAALAGILAVRDDEGERTPVVVAARDLSPGHVLTAEDVTVSDRESATLASGTLTDPADADGHTLTGPVPAGEALIDARLLGPRSAGAATGSADARMVPIRLADAGVGELLREGDRVDVLTVADGPQGAMPDARVLAQGAIVVLAEQTGTARDSERVVLVALAPEQATAVAAASLVSALTVTLH